VSTANVRLARDGSNNYVIHITGVLGEVPLNTTVFRALETGHRVRIDAVAYTVEMGGVVRLGWASGDSSEYVVSLQGNGKLAEPWLEWNCPAGFNGDIVLTSPSTKTPLHFMVALDCTKQTGK
jgi:hypothetical protein